MISVLTNGMVGDMSTFTPANELERLLLAAASDLAARPAFYRALPDHELFIITEGRKPAAEEKVTLTNEPIQVRMIEWDGEEFAPIFSSVDRIGVFATEQVGYLAMQGRDILKMLRGKNLFLNPGSEVGRTFGHQEVDALLDGSMSEPLENQAAAGKKIQLSEPAEYPHQLTEALGRLFAKRKEVNAAYLAMATIDDGAPPHILIGVEVSKNWQSVVEDAAVVVREVNQSGDMVDFAEVTADPSDFVSNHLRTQTTPFYKRKKWLGLF